MPITSLGRYVSRSAQDLLFRTVHNRNLIYNTCWEDPRIDRELLRLDAASEVVVLTSAGCNALDYLLDSPACVHAVDVNPRQNALLELKLAVIRRGVHADLYAMFGAGSHDAAVDLYAELREQLPESAARFWDRKIRYFDRRRGKPSFYYHGTAGAVAWVVTRHLGRNRRLRAHLFELLDAESLEEQREIYARIEPLLWGRFVSWLIQRGAVMSMLGVPRAQIRLIKESYPDGMRGFVADRIRHVATEVMIRDNYFWRVYLTGAYTASCCPNYLKAENLPLLRANADRVRIYNDTVSGFLRRHPGRYSHFVLLDHQDWMVRHEPDALAEEWELILRNSRPGTRILMRSAGAHVDFIPEFARRALRFFPQRTAELHRLDRVGTYGSLYAAEVL